MPDKVEGNAKGNIEEMNKINSQVMECSMELMRHSFKPMLITFIPLLILAAWMNKVLE